MAVVHVLDADIEEALGKAQYRPPGSGKGAASGPLTTFDTLRVRAFVAKNREFTSPPGAASPAVSTALAVLGTAPAGQPALKSMKLSSLVDGTCSTTSSQYQSHQPHSHKTPNRVTYLKEHRAPLLVYIH